MAFFATCAIPAVDGSFEAFVQIHELVVRRQPSVELPWKLDCTLNVFLKEGLAEPVTRVGVSLGLTTENFLSGSVPSLLLAQLQANPQPQLTFLETKAARDAARAAAAAAGASASMVV